MDPARLVRDHLAKEPPPPGPLVLIGAGKASARMAAGVEDAVPRPCRNDAVVVTAAGCEVPLRDTQIVIGGHPVPDARSVSAATLLSRTLAAGQPEAFVLALISGGASSLLAQPRPPITLDEKMAINRLLLACGADIAELNTVRKHLSVVKGGGLLRMVRGRGVRTLILSDVVGDDPSTIGSGPTVADPTTFADARAVLRKYDLVSQVPPPVLAVLEAGSRGEAEETIKPDRSARRATPRRP